MNRSLIIPALAVALAFGAGYAARGVGKSDAATGGDVAGAEGAPASKTRGGGSGADRVGKIANRSGAKGKVFGAPFAPGQAKAWLESLGQTEGDDELAHMRFCQQCGRLDAGSADELAVACLEAAWAIDANDSVMTKKFKHPDLPGEWLGPVLVRLAELAPERALALMQNSGGQSLPDSALQAVFDTVARQNPKLAQAALTGLAEEDRNAALEALTKSWSKSDPVAALAMLDGMTDVEDMRSLCVKAMVERNPELAFSIALSDATGRHETGSLLTLIGADTEMRERVAEWAADYAGPDPAGIRSGVLEEITRRDSEMGKALYSRMASNMTTEEQVKAAAQITTALAGSLGGDVEGWIKGLAEGPGKQSALAAAVRRGIDGSVIARNNIDAVPNGAITRSNIDAILNNPGRTSADFINPIDGSTIPGVPAAASVSTANIVTCGLSSGSDPSVETWLEAMEPSEQKRSLTLQLISKFQDSDPDRAMRWIDSLPSGDDKQTLVRETELKQELDRLRTVQVLGDIPVVGRLFRGSSNQTLPTGSVSGAIIGNQTGRQDVQQPEDSR